MSWIFAIFVVMLWNSAGLEQRVKELESERNRPIEYEEPY